MIEQLKQIEKLITGFIAQIALLIVQIEIGQITDLEHIAERLRRIIGLEK